MVRFLPLWFVLLGLLLAPQTPAAERPNVLFIAIDDLNDWVGFLDGHPQVKTPNMDRLASRGVVFTNAHCAAPLCNPSRAAVFSGMQPYHTGVFGNQGGGIRAKRPDLVLLPEYFQSQEYHTYGTGKLLHHGVEGMCQEKFSAEQRWSPFRGKKPQPQGETRPLNRLPNDRQAVQPGKFSSFDWGAVSVKDSEMGDGKITNWAVKQLSTPRGSDSQQKPMFLAVGFYRPHIPLYAPQAYFDMYPTSTTEVPEVPTGDLDDVSQAAVALAHTIDTAGLHRNVIRHGKWKEAVGAYLACISFVDAQIGKLLDALDKGPYADNTVIILWSDHGWHLGEKEHWGKTTGWERATRVPLAIVPAKSDAADYRAGADCGQTVSLIDLYPTLIEMCNLDPKPELDGVSLVAQLRDPAAPIDRVVVTTVEKDVYSLRDMRWRLIRYADGSEELYDHQADPNEWKNLAHDERFADVKRKLLKSLPSK